MAAHGRAEGTRALIEVLLLHRHRPALAVLAGITAALAARSTSPELAPSRPARPLAPMPAPTT
jgi:hypothetical protein